MLYSPYTISNYFIGKSFENNEKINPLKLVKLLYFAQGWNLALTNKPLLNVPIEAWKYGVIIDFMHALYKKYGNSPITKYLKEKKEDLIRLTADSRTLSILDRVNEVYACHSGMELANLTNKKDSPWDIIWNPKEESKLIEKYETLKRRVKLWFNMQLIIPDEIIKKYFIEHYK